MPTSAAGSPERTPRGFTLLELLVVLAIAALATAGVALALRDSSATALDREAQRLAALLEAARAQAQVQGVRVVWRPRGAGFAFDGLDATDTALPTTWLHAGVVARITSGACPEASPCLTLGPDALQPPQSVTLSLRDDPSTTVRLASDGVRPYTLVVGDAP